MKYLISILLLTYSVVNGQNHLQDYQRLAAENNPGLKASYKVFEAKMKKTTQVNSLPDPTLSFGYFISPVETRVGPQRARFSLSQMFPWFGTLQSQEDVAASEAQVFYNQFLNKQKQLNAQVAKAYYPLVELEALVIEEANIIEYLKLIKSIATVRYEAGGMSLADVLRIDVLLEQRETEISILKNEEQSLLTSFNALLNRPDSTEVYLDSLQMPIKIASQTEWSTHPLFTELDAKYLVGEKRIATIRKSGNPKVGLGLDYVFVDKRDDMNVPDNGQDVIMPMVSVSLPIFRRKYSSAIEEINLVNESIELSRMNLHNEFNSNFQQLKYEYQSAIERHKLYDQLEEQTERINRLLLTEFESGKTGLTDILDVQIQLLNYKKKKIKALTMANKVVADIDYLMN